MITKQNWIHFEEIDSTNEYLLKNDYPHGTIITANTQTKGRGRKNREWLDIPGNTFIFSILLNFQDFQKYSYFSLIIALCVIEAIHKMYKDLRLNREVLYIKWPNDVLLQRNGKIGKLAGILIETLYNQTFWKVVIGIGLNWKNAPIIKYTSIKFPPISLFNENIHLEPNFFLNYLILKFNEFSIENPFDFLSYRDMVMQYHFLNQKRIRWKGIEFIIQGLTIEGYLQLKKGKETIIIHDWEEEIEIL